MRLLDVVVVRANVATGTQCNAHYAREARYVYVTLFLSYLGTATTRIRHRQASYTYPAVALDHPFTRRMVISISETGGARHSAHL